MSVLPSPLQPIHQGVLLTRRGEPHRVPYTLRFLGPDDLERLEAFRAFIFSRLHAYDAYVPEAPEFTGLHLGERGLTLGVEADGALIACAVLGLPQPGMPAFADDLLGERPPVTATAHMASCMVHPDYRGNGLQRLLVSMRTALAAGSGRPHLLSRVAFSNPLSLSNMLACGFTIRRVLVMHGDRLRYLLHRNVAEAPPRFEPGSDRVLPLGDHDAQFAALDAGWVGRAVTLDAAGPVLTYARPLPGPAVRAAFQESVLEMVP